MCHTCQFWIIDIFESCWCIVLVLKVKVFPSKVVVLQGHGNKFERMRSNYNFEWTKFEFSKNRNKFESLCSNFEQTAVSIKRTSAPVRPRLASWEHKRPQGAAGH